VNVIRINLDPLAFILHFLNLFWIASRLVCSFCEAMTGSLSVSTTAVLSAKVAVVDSGEGGRSAVYRTTLPWGEFFLLSFHLYEEVSAKQIGF
jgi:hypothetical protein